MGETFPIAARLIFGSMFAMGHRLLRPKWAKAAFILHAGAAATVQSRATLIQAWADASRLRPAPSW
jgi:hypothetical protein